MGSAEEIQKELNLLMSNIDGLYAIAIVDRDGVPLMKSSLKDSVPELALRPQFLAPGPGTMEQSGKLGIGKCQTMVCEFERHQVINFNVYPYTVSLIASAKANTGHILSLESSFVSVVEELAKIFDQC